MALDRAYLASLGLEIAKKKYYNAAKVEDVVEAFCRREAALTQEKNVLAQSNETLRERLEALSLGREEIGDAILSAKTISQQLIGEACDKAEAMTAESVESADALISAAQEKALPAAGGSVGKAGAAGGFPLRAGGRRRSVIGSPEKSLKKPDCFHSPVFSYSSSSAPASRKVSLTSLA